MFVGQTLQPYFYSMSLIAEYVKILLCDHFSDSKKLELMNESLKRHSNELHPGKNTVLDAEHVKAVDAADEEARSMVEPEPYSNDTTARMMATMAAADVYTSTALEASTKAAEYMLAKSNAIVACKRAVSAQILVYEYQRTDADEAVGELGSDAMMSVYKMNTKAKEYLDAFQTAKHAEQVAKTLGEESHYMESFMCAKRRHYGDFSPEDYTNDDELRILKQMKS
jgi:hypothetical protein